MEKSVQSIELYSSFTALLLGVDEANSLFPSFLSLPEKAKPPFVRLLGYDYKVSFILVNLLK
jgi:hypothetical protein